MYFYHRSWVWEKPSQIECCGCWLCIGISYPRNFSWFTSRWCVSHRACIEFQLIVAGSNLKFPWSNRVNCNLPRSNCVDCNFIPRRHHRCARCKVPLSFPLSLIFFYIFTFLNSSLHSRSQPRVVVMHCWVQIFHNKMLKHLTVPPWSSLNFLVE
jgi:hypothetical protein